MMRRRVCTVGFLLAVVLLFPRDSHAGLWEFIIEMSGPQMFGGMSGCVLNLEDKTVHYCSIVGVPVHQENGLKFGWPLTTARPRAWLLLQSGSYLSTGKDSGDSNFKFGHVGMLSADPALAFRTGLGRYQIVGFSYNFLFSGDFEPVHNYAVKVTPMVFRAAGLDFDLTLRFYPKGFDVVESTDPAILLRGDKFETVVSFTGSLPLF